MSEKLIFNIGGRTIRAEQTTRGYDRDPMWDLFEGEERLTSADPIWLEHPPTAELVAHLIHPRIVALMALMAEFGIRQCNDYPDMDDDLIAATTAPYEALPGRYAYVHGDETYHFVGTCDTVQGAVDGLGSIIGEEYGGLPVAIRDLDTDEDLPFESVIQLKGEGNVTVTLTAAQREILAEAIGDAIAYRTNSGEGAEDEEDAAAAARFEALAGTLGIEVST